jgi:hypothetical protein
MINMPVVSRITFTKVPASVTSYKSGHAASISSCVVGVGGSLFEEQAQKAIAKANIDANNM